MTSNHGRNPSLLRAQVAAVVQSGATPSVPLIIHYFSSLSPEHIQSSVRSGVTLGYPSPRRQRVTESLTRFFMNVREENMDDAFQVLEKVSPEVLRGIVIAALQVQVEYDHKIEIERRQTATPPAVTVPQFDVIDDDYQSSYDSGEFKDDHYLVLSSPSDRYRPQHRDQEISCDIIPSDWDGTRMGGEYNSVGTQATHVTFPPQERFTKPVISPMMDESHIPAHGHHSTRVMSPVLYEEVLAPQQTTQRPRTRVMSPGLSTPSHQSKTIIPGNQTTVKPRNVISPSMERGFVGNEQQRPNLKVRKQSPTRLILPDERAPHRVSSSHSTNNTQRLRGSPSPPPKPLSVLPIPITPGRPLPPSRDKIETNLYVVHPPHPFQDHSSPQHRRTESNQASQSPNPLIDFRNQPSPTRNQQQNNSPQHSTTTNNGLSRISLHWEVMKNNRLAQGVK